MDRLIKAVVAIFLLAFILIMWRISTLKPTIEPLDFEPEVDVWRPDPRWENADGKKG